MSKYSVDETKKDKKLNEQRQAFLMLGLIE
jgi:hypothetical protein